MDSKLTLTDNITQEQLTEIYTNSYIKDAVKQDNREFMPIKHPLIKYYSAQIHSQFVGAFLQMRFSQWEIELHSLLTKDAMRFTREFGKMIIDKSFNDNKEVQRITVFIIDGLNTVKNFCEKIGFKLEGIKRKACLKNNTYKDVYMYGITREDWRLL